MVKLLSRKRQQTQKALIEATLALVEERGFAGVTLDEVAARAGVTKGAVYSNYRSKGELLWAAADTRRLHLRPVVPRGDARSAARIMARAWMEIMPQAQREAGFLGELQRYVRTDPELHAQQAAQQKAQFQWMAQQLAETFGDQLALPPRVLALAVQALTLGFTAQYERTPDEVTEDVVAAAYEALALGATVRKAPPSAG